MNWIKLIKAKDIYEHHNRLIEPQDLKNEKNLLKDIINGEITILNDKKEFFNIIHNYFKEKGLYSVDSLVHWDIINKETLPYFLMDAICRKAIEKYHGAKTILQQKIVTKNSDPDLFWQLADIAAKNGDASSLPITRNEYFEHNYEDYDLNPDAAEEARSKHKEKRK